MGIMYIAATANTGKTNPAFFLILIVLVGLFYFVMIRPQRNRQRRTMQVQNEVTPGTRIRTTAGMYGTVVSSDDRDIVVELAPGVEVKMLRRAVMDVLPEESPEDGFAGDADEQDYRTEHDISADEEYSADHEDHEFSADDDFKVSDEELRHEDGHVSKDGHADGRPDVQETTTSKDERDLKDRNA